MRHKTIQITDYFHTSIDKFSIHENMINNLLAFKIFTRGFCIVCTFVRRLLFKSSCILLQMHLIVCYANEAIFVVLPCFNDDKPNTLNWNKQTK